MVRSNTAEMEHDNFRIVMIRFGEIFLKSEPVRREFLAKLKKNIILGLESLGSGADVTITRSRILVKTDMGIDPIPLLSRIFGIIDLSPVILTGTTIEDMCDAAVELAKEHLEPFTKFAVRARREGIKDYTSQELASVAGSKIIQAIQDLTVDLRNPSYETFLEARSEGGLVYDTRIKGPGGLPYGTQGKALALLSAGIDSPVAAWLMMRRGVMTEFMNIDPGFFGGIDIRENLINNLAALSLWVPGHTLTLVTLSAESFYKHLMEISEPRFRCVICKRVMLELASSYAIKNHCSGIITGDNLGQVATQTIENLVPISAGIALPVYRPLIGYDKEEIIALAKKIGSFRTEPGDTSCKVLPPRPATRSSFEKIKTLMNRSDIESCISNMLDKAVIIRMKNGTIYSFSR